MVVGVAAYTNMLKKLHNASVRPVHKPTFKFYMLHTDHQAKCSEAAELDPRFSSTASKDILKLRCTIARKLFENEHNEVQVQMEAENAANFEKHLARFHGETGEVGPAAADQAMYVLLPSLLGIRLTIFCFLVVV